ncbi:ParB/RepB/Spo0J family partition protein [Azospirillum rugosum]|uniref:ParB family chromosome partitioning protein n=1 Tax=Azospirillum rugosum TaxID=416170 RepID=A0ABS4SSJ5_9PROT|nr:ParB/RepB/Spo0J family partition protein [Azospirillum rugosum]MBP2295073.1 ParB family chromosome partitioning protein [Azospirillum rugosum]MDQ0528896.1 ParB family chromosome partitioning protein [Azospirillum rugosum]
MAPKKGLDTANTGLLKRAISRAAGGGSSSNRALFGLSAKMRFREIPLGQIEPDPDQPRRNAQEADIGALAASIEQKGLLQPINVREIAADRFMIIAGERRYWAFQQLARDTIPAMVLDTDDAQALALIENVQRVDLHPIDVARSLERLIDDKGLTQEQAAVLIGKSQEYVARLLGILRLPAPILEDAPQQAHVSVSVLMELSELGDAALQAQLWERAKSGLTVKAVREAKQQRKAPSPTPASYQPALRALHNGMAKLHDLSAGGRRLEDADRKALLDLRAAIDALLGD